jgi:hypothetical protein
VSDSPSASASVSPSGSISPSASPSLGYTGYSRGASAALPSGDADLTTAYSGQDVTDVSSINGVRVDVHATGQYAIHQFKNFCPTAGQLTFTWRGQSSINPYDTGVYLQIYNRNSSTWETLDSNTVAAAGVDFTLSGIIVNPANYKDARQVVSCRVYQLGL